MRFIPTNCLKPGQIVGRHLSYDKNRVLLRKGVVITASHIKKLKRLGFQGVYIDDDISKDIHAVNLINDELRFKTKNEIHSLFITVENGAEYKVNRQMNVLKEMISEVVDEITMNKKMMINVIDIRSYDEYTYSHSINVSVLATLLGTVLNLNKKDLNDLAMGALMHDIGKVFIDKKVINKADRLTPEEFAMIKMHSQAGYNYIYPNNALSDEAKSVILSHHEFYNGKGYPSGVSGQDIPLGGRIACAADVYDALISDRPYRQAMLPSDAVEYIMSGYDSMFDPVVVNALIRKTAPYPIGTCVKLSTGDTGIVVENFEMTCLRPKIRILNDGKLTNNYVDLTNDYSTLNVTIQQIVNI